MAWLAQLVKIVASVIAFALVVSAGVVGYRVWNEGPYSAIADADAAMERLKDTDLARAGMNYAELKKLLGEPERAAPRRALEGALWVRWYRGAVVGYLHGDEMYTVTIRDASRTGEQPFWGKTVFRGSLHGLRIGDPAPASQRKRQADKIRSATVTWELENGRITSVTATNPNFYAAPVTPPRR